MFKVLVLSISVLLTNQLNAQQLIINEISQGTGSSEYVEFVVIGAPTCATPVPTLDLRKVIFDDNNGYFAAGTGTGIATGAVRFANVSFWQSIPQGTYIVIYNDASPNTGLPPDDASMADGNCRLVIPSSSTLLEKTTLSPTTTIQTYPPDINWTSGGSWSPIAMANTDDSFQVPSIPSTGVPFHSVSWGNNVSNTIVYFAGSAAGKVFSFTNTTSNNWNLVANWTSTNVPAGQTPGVANNLANDAWIGSMNPLCSVNPGMNVTPLISNETCLNACDGSISTSVTNGVLPYTYSWSNGATSSSISNVCPGSYTVTVTGANACSAIQTFVVLAGLQGSTITPLISDETCVNSCDGSISTTVTNGVSPYTYSWSNGATSNSIVNVCPGSYTVTVTGANGCSAIQTFVVLAGSQGSNASISNIGPFNIQDVAQQVQALNPGGVWFSNCGFCLSNSGVFSPQVSGVGSWQVCYTLGSANCADTQCITILVTNPCTSQTTSESLTICPGTSIMINGTMQSAAGQYSAVFLDVNQCDSMHTVDLNLYPASPNIENIVLCEFDSVLIFNQWIDTTQTLSQVEQTVNGCDYLHTVNVELDTCVIEPPVIYIPNVFTPNGDMVNDTFEIVIQNGVVEIGYILNRWGNIIYTFSPTELKWDGRDAKSGLLVLDGVYTYIVYFNPAKTVNEVYQGFITVIR